MCYWQRVGLLHWNSQNWRKVLKLCQKSLRAMLTFTASVLRFTETQLREELETFQQIKEVHITEALGLIQNGLRLISSMQHLLWIYQQDNCALMSTNRYKVWPALTPSWAASCPRTRNMMSKLSPLKQQGCVVPDLSKMLSFSLPWQRKEKLRQVFCPGSVKYKHIQ